MPAPLLTKPDMLGRLMDLFREKGFDGASLSDISESTGLGKSSLYHHFPNGKEEIALAGAGASRRTARAGALRAHAVVRSAQKEARSDAGHDRQVLRGREEGVPARAPVCQRRRQALSTAPCRAFNTWIDAVEALGVESGLPRAVARLRAEDLVVRIEGALVVCAGTGNTSVFARVIRDLRESVLAPLPRR